LRWATPLGWAEELRPFTGARPAVLLLPVAASVVLLWVAGRLGASRDIGSGLLPVGDTAEPRLACCRRRPLRHCAASAAA
jgi:polyether ionophore transport system permease protein